MGLDIVQANHHIKEWKLTYFFFILKWEERGGLGGATANARWAAIAYFVGEGAATALLMLWNQMFALK